MSEIIPSWTWAAEMKYAILSDIHGNLEAFEAVLQKLAKEGIEEIVFLGDIVGYGPNPRECIALLQEKTRAFVAGNHDWGVTGLTDIRSFNSAAREAVQWTRNQLDLREKTFLADLPLQGEGEGFDYTHSTPIHPEQWNYIFSPAEALKNLRTLKNQVCFVGHSHIPVAFSLTPSGEITFTNQLSEITLATDHQYLINVGSVGQPRDGNPQAAYGILDQDRNSFSLRRVYYDVRTTQEKILAVGLPPLLAERIGWGW